MAVALPDSDAELAALIYGHSELFERGASLFRTAIVEQDWSTANGILASLSPLMVVMALAVQALEMTAQIRQGGASKP